MIRLRLAIPGPEVAPSVVGMISVSETGGRVDATFYPARWPYADGVGLFAEFADAAVFAFRAGARNGWMQCGSRWTLTVCDGGPLEVPDTIPDWLLNAR